MAKNVPHLNVKITNQKFLGTDLFEMKITTDNGNVVMSMSQGVNGETELYGENLTVINQ
ncbi:hypothetical protein [Weissella hellenica]|uniref:hypothetical protein n=1 Tax=Weissella hellenica TaxID=46256 RepID=UPI0038856200